LWRSDPTSYFWVKTYLVADLLLQTIDGTCDKPMKGHNTNGGIVHSGLPRHTLPSEGEVMFEHGCGGMVTDATGREYIDFVLVMVLLF